MKAVFAFIRSLHGWLVLALFWLRELAGWVLLVLGLLIFYQVFAFLVGTNRILPVLPLIFVGFIVFRAGVQLLKVSAAALVCLRAQDQLDRPLETGPQRRRPAPRLAQPTAPFEVGPSSAVAQRL